LVQWVSWGDSQLGCSVGLVDLFHSLITIPHRDDGVSREQSTRGFAVQLRWGEDGSWHSVHLTADA